MSENAHFVDSRGEAVARVPLAEINDTADDIEVLRGDLVQILAGDLPDTVVVRFGDRVRTLLDHESGVDVRFASGRTGRYDVVIGADGQHSAVRRLVFGPDAECLAHLGAYFALAALPGGAQTDCADVIFNVPGRMVGCFRYAEKSVAVFQFRSAVISHDHRDLAAQKRILIEAFDGHRSWRIPEAPDRQGTVAGLVSVVLALGSVLVNFAGTEILKAHRSPDIPAGGSAVSTAAGVHLYVVMAGLLFVMAAAPVTVLVKKWRRCVAQVTGGKPT